MDRGPAWEKKMIGSFCKITQLHTERVAKVCFLLGFKKKKIMRSYTLPNSKMRLE